MSEISLPKCLVTLNHNLLCALDLETTGLVAGYHEIVQICILPLDGDLNPVDEISPFYMNMCPLHPERIDPYAMKVNGLDPKHLATCPEPHQVAEVLEDWFQGLELPQNKRLAYLTQNAPFDIPFMRLWLGHKGFDRYFMRRGRDTMFLAQGYNDAAAFQGKPVPFGTVSLRGLCNKLGIQLDNHHDALADCVATAKVYKELLRFEI